MQKLIATIENYIPLSAQEEADRRTMLHCIASGMDAMSREDSVAHLSGSGWIVDKNHTHVLMIYHNIYKSWSWTGGHADGDTDLLAVAMREAEEETGVTGLRAISEEPISLEILTVNGHVKRGKTLSPHLHMNLTYLLEADMDAPLRIKPDENSAVRWMEMDEAVRLCSEEQMRPVYEKLNQRARKM